MSAYSVLTIICWSAWHSGPRAYKRSTGRQRPTAPLRSAPRASYPLPLIHSSC